MALGVVIEHLLLDVVEGADGGVNIYFRVGLNKYEPMSEGYICMVMARRLSSDTFSKDLLILWAIRS